MGKALEFALTMFFITIVHVIFALYIVCVFRGELTKYFGILNSVLTNL